MFPETHPACTGSHIRNWPDNKRRTRDTSQTPRSNLVQRPCTAYQGHMLTQTPRGIERQGKLWLAVLSQSSWQRANV